MATNQIVSGKSYVVECPAIGTFGVFTDAEVTNNWVNFNELYDEVGDIDGMAMSGFKTEVSATYQYLRSITDGPEVDLKAGDFLTLSDLAADGQLPVKILLSEVGFTFTAGEKATVSIKGIYADFMAAL